MARIIHSPAPPAAGQTICLRPGPTQRNFVAFSGFKLSTDRDLPRFRGWQNDGGRMTNTWLNRLFIIFE